MKLPGVGNLDSFRQFQILIGVLIATFVAMVIAIVVIALSQTEQEKLCGEIWDYTVQVVEHENYAIWNSNQYNDHIYRDYVEYGEDAHMVFCPNVHQMELDRRIEELIEDIDELEQIR